MATVEGFETHLFLLPDISTRCSTTPDKIHHLTLILNGPTALITLILPTMDFTLALCPSTQFEDWVVTTLSDDLSACDVTDDQREIVLHLALAYQGFYHLLDTGDDQEQTNFHLFAAQLVNAALSLDAHKPADAALAEVVNWLHDAHLLPADTFWSLDPPKKQGAPPLTPGLSVAPHIPPLPAAVEAGAAPSGDAARTSSPTRSSPPSVVGAPVAMQLASDAGYKTDSSMPSLRTEMRSWTATHGYILM
ncbi:hypothetical protein C8Q80DRAFT_1122107 [Daedaleopsis nitida]|nr:hypothetical protein C8Q80DRAFT_1122107 [Daedaleopsis nitida]